MENFTSSVLLEDAAGETISLIHLQTSQGLEIRATLLRLTRHQVAFEVYTPDLVLRTSEVLTKFQILIQGRTIYSGNAVISSLVNMGTVLVCEATLDESWVDAEVFALTSKPESLQSSYSQFFQRWQNDYKILPEYKLLIADTHAFLTDLRLWLEQVELSIRAMPSGDRAKAEREVVGGLVQPVTSSLNYFFEKFELIAGKVEEELQPVHSLYVKRQLHPLLLCSPFMYRIYRKPLGYAGDYEMVNMILRDPHEGSSVFSKVLNRWFLGQVPAEAHRNRVKYLKQMLVQESLRGMRRGKPIRILNLGCGPAGEIQEFLREESIACEHADFTLLDFNNETIGHANRVLADIKRQFNRRTPIRLQKKSVHQVLKEGNRPDVVTSGNNNDGKYDLIYCAGLFDYLSDRTCRQLMNVFHDWLAPGGLLVATNVDVSNPIQRIMGYIFEWHLVHRTSQQMASLAPIGASLDNCKVTADSTGCNIFIEVRKPLARL